MSTGGAAPTRVRGADLGRFVELALRRAGVADMAAAGAARALATASQRGQDTHGVRLLPFYLQCLDSGRVNRTPAMQFHATGPATGYVDADHGLGHAASFMAVDHAVRLAADIGIGAVTVRNSSHFGAAGVYALHAAGEGMVAIATTHADALVVPHGGRAPFFGTNPLAFACPLRDEQPLVLDMATSAIPFNRVFLRREQDRPLPEGVAVDDDGVPTTDPHKATALMPVGGADYSYKGAGLAAMIDLLCAALTGMDWGHRMPSMLDASHPDPIAIGHFFLVLDPGRFGMASGFMERARAFVDDLRAQPARPGQRVMAPGDPETRHAEERAVIGVPLEPSTLRAFQAIAQRFDLAGEFPWAASTEATG